MPSCMRCPNCTQDIQRGMYFIKKGNNNIVPTFQKSVEKIYRYIFYVRVKAEK